ncbi:TetR/AcrR family transcriptional regulator [Streptomyces zaomyceticus]|uniref:TetR/AcrR family transcriptional regulator n=1 Tax=Streptomyces zaomyceticus TaxID=68286 RepID=UPI0034347D21
MPQPPPARRGTRPRNRRELILTAASDLFVKQGYSKVAMADLAGAVGITPSALYRHFKGKQEILATALAVGLEPVQTLMNALDPADPAAMADLAGCALDTRPLSLMWQREARNLAPEAYQPVRDVIRVIGRQLTDYVHGVRPDLSPADADLLAWSVIAVVSSPSFHHLDLPRPAFAQLLAELADAVLATGLPDAPPSPRRTPRPSGLAPASRREELLAQAVRMFATHGYAEVGIEDIGNAVGIAGPSVYNHWSTKLDLLVTALRRGASTLAMDTASAYRQATGPADALRRLLRSYVALSHTHPEIFGLLITDLDHLPDTELHAIRQAQHDYVSEWVHLLRLEQPHLDPIAARIRVHAVLGLANDTARTSHLQRNPAVPAAVETIGARLLGLPTPTVHQP